MTLSIYKKQIERIVITWQADNPVSYKRGYFAALKYCKARGFKVIALEPDKPLSTKGRAKITAERKI